MYEPPLRSLLWHGRKSSYGFLAQSASSPSLNREYRITYYALRHKKICIRLIVPLQSHLWVSSSNPSSHNHQRLIQVQLWGPYCTPPCLLGWIWHKDEVGSPHYHKKKKNTRHLTFCSFVLLRLKDILNQFMLRYLVHISPISLKMGCEHLKNTVH